MAGIFTVNDRSLEEIGTAAVAMVGTEDPAQRHIGILHRDSDTTDLRLLHLAWHHRLKSDIPESIQLWVVPNFPNRRMRQVSAICRMIWRSNATTGIPYSFSDPTDCFDSKTGEFLVGPARHGLTCSSFVLAVFHVAGLQLAAYNTWPTNREDDIVWQRKIVEALKHPGSRATPQHIEAVESEIGSVRFRPEETAGAAAVESLPAAFDDAARISLEVLRLLRLG